MNRTRVSQRINAPRAVVYKTLLDPSSVARWKVPDGMSAHIHTFEPREGGVIRSCPTKKSSKWMSSRSRRRA